MSDIAAHSSPSAPLAHHHVFLGAGHEKNERKTWAVIALCSMMMVLEIGGGSLFGSLALVADGLHMSTHAVAMLIAAIAYTYARKHANDSAFAFGTGKLGDLAGYSSAIVLAMIALLIGYEAISRLLNPVVIDFNVAIEIACLGLFVNILSAWLLSGGDHGHSHGHSHGHGHGHGHDDHHAEEVRQIDTGHGMLVLEIFEDGVPPRFRVSAPNGHTLPAAESLVLQTIRLDGTRQSFGLVDRGACLESRDDIPEPHDFVVRLTLNQQGHTHVHEVVFAERAHGPHAGAHRDNNMRAAFIHVLADAAVSVLAILGLSAGKFLGWTFMDPIMGIVGMVVIANWSFALIRDTGAILLDKTPDRRMAENIRKDIEASGDRLNDLHLWRLGPGHLGVILSIVTAEARDADYYRVRLARFSSLSHVTIEVLSARQ